MQVVIVHVEHLGQIRFENLFPRHDAGVFPVTDDPADKSRVRQINIRRFCAEGPGMDHRADFRDFRRQRFRDQFVDRFIRIQHGIQIAVLHDVCADGLKPEGQCQIQLLAVFAQQIFDADPRIGKARDLLVDDFDPRNIRPIVLAREAVNAVAFFVKALQPFDAARNPVGDHILEGVAEIPVVIIRVLFHPVRQAFLKRRPVEAAEVIVDFLFEEADDQIAVVHRHFVHQILIDAKIEMLVLLDCRQKLLICQKQIGPVHQEIQDGIQFDVGDAFEISFGFRIGLFAVLDALLIEFLDIGRNHKDVAAPAIINVFKIALQKYQIVGIGKMGQRLAGPEQIEQRLLACQALI